MGFVIAYAPKLIIIAGILIVALRECCNYVMELLGFCKLEASCDSETADQTTLDNFQYPYMAINSCSNIATTLHLNIRASLVPLIFEGAQECRSAVLARCGREDGSMECAVCLSEFERGEEVQITPNCCHIFHSECIYTWLQQNQKTCPLCRTSLLVATTNIAAALCNL